MSSYEEWCTQECKDGITNQDVVNSFVDTYLKWVSSKETVVGCEMRKLCLKEYTNQHRVKIMKLVYELSVQ